MELDHIDIPNKIEFKFNNSIINSNDYYKNINHIYNNMQNWFNPIKYLMKKWDKNNEMFFLLDTEKISLILEKYGKIRNLYEYKYTIFNLLQYAMLFEKYEFLNNKKDYLYMRRNNDDKEAFILYLHKYFNVKKNNTYNYETMGMPHNSNDYKLNKQYDVIITKNTSKLDLNVNQEINNISYIIKSVLYIVKNLNKGGAAVIYFTSLLEDSSQQLILLLQSCFKNVHIFHPHYYSYNWSNWVICDDFIGETFSTDLMNELNNYKSNTITKLFKKNVISGNNYLLGPLHYLNTQLINRIKFYLDPPELNKNKYMDEILHFYMNYKIIVINPYYIFKSLKNILKKIIKNILKDIIDDKNKIKIFLIYKPELNFFSVIKKYQKYENIQKYLVTDLKDYFSKMSKSIIISNSLDTFNKNLDIAFICNFNSITEPIKIWNLLNNNSHMIFINCKTDRVNCFLNEIYNEYELIFFNVNIVIKKINN
jgi:hypothetical protein